LGLAEVFGFLLSQQTSRPYGQPANDYPGQDVNHIVVLAINCAEEKKQNQRENKPEGPATGLSGIINHNSPGGAVS